MPIYNPDALAKLRAEMEKEQIDYYLMTSSDCHASEYVSDYFKVTEYISGCTSDNVILIVGAEDAWLWTDGRYFISAAAELENSAERSGSRILLMKDGEKGVPKVDAFLKELLKDGASLGFDGRQVSAEKGKQYRQIAEEAGGICFGTAALPDAIWEDRPALPSHPVMVLPEEICGQTCSEKLADVLADLRKEGADSLFLSKLDDIMWLLNIRGKDVPYNPVALSYALITADSVDLFLQESEETEEFLAYAKQNGITLHPYENVTSFLEAHTFGGAILCDSSATNDAVWQLLNQKQRVLDRNNPTGIRKACKNETEMENIRKFYLLDSVALCKFIFYIKKNAGKLPMTEMEAAAKLDALRAEIPGFLDLSFPTIPAVGANAAMAHYAPEGKGEPIGDKGFLLVDSGGQYLGATTDVTRTIVLGELTEQMKRDFTLVAVSHFRLMNAIFKQGTGGYQLDMIAREPLFAYGLDYNHGTGHGIGYILNVHEGPQRIGSLRPGAKDVPMAVGMLTSDEPGVYREKEYGIRTESITLTVPHSESEFGTFLTFECLTFAPVDLDAIDTAYMTMEDVGMLNAYHEAVREKISPYLEGEELEWLLDATRAIF